MKADFPTISGKHVHIEVPEGVSLKEIPRLLTQFLQFLKYCICMSKQNRKE